MMDSGKPAASNQPDEYLQGESYQGSAGVEEVKAFGKKEWSLVGEWVKAELNRRYNGREDLELQWAEIDRQVGMQPEPRDVQSGEIPDWYPQVEMPFQFNNLEVTAADARRLLFPAGASWFTASSDLEDEYLARWQKRRQKIPLFSKYEQPQATQNIDQEMVDTLVRAVINHFHKLYDFRGQMDLAIAECIKYGTCAGRNRLVEFAKFSSDYRAMNADSIQGPAFITSSIKNTFLDDAPSVVMHEGVAVAPLTMRRHYQRLTNLYIAAKEGGPERGWMLDEIKRLVPDSLTDEYRDHVELIEVEGDLVVPKRSKGSIFLPNCLVTVAVGRNGARGVRFQINPLPHSSYVFGHYMRTEVDSPYGTSEMVKGVPIQRGAVFAFADMAVSSALNARPPVKYPRYDTQFAANGGPEVYPGAKWACDDPTKVGIEKISSLSDALQTFMALSKMYEDLTAVNDPRRGGPMKSHTTAQGNELEAARGLSRTDDFIEGFESGPLTSTLYMQYEIIKRAMTKPTPIFVEANGVKGWVKLSAADLPDRVAFSVVGSQGALDERQKAADFVTATNFVLQLAQLAGQSGQPLQIKFEALADEAYARVGINDASRFIGAMQAPAGGTQGNSPVPGIVSPATGSNIVPLSPAGT